MGRKRTSNKERISISIDKDLINKLRHLEADRSLIFTKAAKEFIENYEKNKKTPKED